jgi:hypothetical protein
VTTVSQPTKLKFDWSTAKGAQLEFIRDTRTRHTAFVGGLGSGKTWSGATKTILYALGNPKCLILVCAPTYRQLRDSTLREFFKVLPRELEENWNKSEYELKLKNGTEILFRSLENYDSVRGVEAAFLWIDEANLISYKAWRVAIGRLRQPGYPHRSCLTTTPRGKTDNWLYEEYKHKKELNPRLSRATYHAKTRDNIENVGAEYIEDLEATYTGEFARQELLGEFVDIIEGRVYPMFERQYHVDYFGEEIMFEEHLPLYGFWDYGIADEGALWLAQTIDVPEHESIPILDPNTGERTTKTIGRGKGLLLVDLILESGQNVDFWIDTVKLIEDKWKPFDKHYGDPAGEQRTATTGKSMADHLRMNNIFVRSKKATNDTGRLIVTKLLNERRLFINSECQQGIAAFTNYHWPLDPDGNRKVGSRDPVHDWSSHPMDALRYGATGLFPVRKPSQLDPRNFGHKDRAPRAGSGGSFTGIKNNDW